MPFFRDAKTRANVISHPIPSIAGTGAGEYIESRLKPIVPALGDLDGFMHRVVGGRDTVDHCFGALRGVVGMEFNHSGAGIHRVRAIYLDLIIVLGMD